jgi:hypothetical protein
VGVELEEILRSPNLEASEAALADLRSGSVDERLVALLRSLIESHGLRVPTIKTGHAMGPTSPGGRQNDHYFYLALDITAVDGVLVRDAPTAPATVALGRKLLGLRGEARPARVMGPAEWLAALGPGDHTGFRDDEFATKIHRDHLHIGFSSRRGV